MHRCGWFRHVHLFLKICVIAMVDGKVALSLLFYSNLKAKWTVRVSTKLYPIFVALLDKVGPTLFFLRNLVRGRGAPALHYKKKKNGPVSKGNRTQKP